MRQRPDSTRGGRPKALGQYFTPECVVDFACHALTWLSEGVTGGGAAPRAIDPACGDGAFVLGAWRHGLAAPGDIIGVDKDPTLTDSWTRSGLTGGAEVPRVCVGDGLLPAADLSALVPPGAFDFVIGNPPFHGHGVRHEAPRALQALAQRYAIWRLGARAAADLSRLRLYPVELLFLERFVQLARPGGLISIILPEGVFANARSAAERRWLFAHHTVHGIVGLPRAAFRGAGITARTCLCLIRKAPPPPEHETYLAEIEDSDPPLPESLERVLELWQRRQPVGQPKPWLPMPS